MLWNENLSENSFFRDLVEHLLSPWRTRKSRLGVSTLASHITGLTKKPRHSNAAFSNKHWFIIPTKSYYRRVFEKQPVMPSHEILKDCLFQGWATIIAKVGPENIHQPSRFCLVPGPRKTSSLPATRKRPRENEAGKVQVIDRWPMETPFQNEDAFHFNPVHHLKLASTWLQWLPVTSIVFIWIHQWVCKSFQTSWWQLIDCTHMLSWWFTSVVAVAPILARSPIATAPLLISVFS